MSECAFVKTVLHLYRIVVYKAFGAWILRQPGGDERCWLLHLLYPSLGELESWQSGGGGGGGGCTWRSHRNPVSIPRAFSSASLSSGCAWVISFYDQLRILDSSKHTLSLKTDPEAEEPMTEPPGAPFQMDLVGRPGS